MDSLSIERPAMFRRSHSSRSRGVFGRCYGVKRDQMKDIIESRVGAKELVVEGADTVRKALRGFAASRQGGFRRLPDRTIGARRGVRGHRDLGRDCLHACWDAVDQVTPARANDHEPAKVSCRGTLYFT